MQADLAPTDVRMPRQRISGRPLRARGAARTGDDRGIARGGDRLLGGTAGTPSQFAVYPRDQHSNRQTAGGEQIRRRAR